MNIIEVKNNLVKLCYEDELVLSGFSKIDDTNKSYIAQILHLEATRIGKVAIAKIIYENAALKPPTNKNLILSEILYHFFKSSTNKPFQPMNYEFSILFHH